MIKFVSDLWQVGGFLWVLRFPPPNKTDHRDITEILLKVALNIITPHPNPYIYILWLQDDKDSARCFILKINKMEEDSKQPIDDSVDSDDEYVKESNYSTLKQVWHQIYLQKILHNVKFYQVVKLWSYKWLPYIFLAHPSNPNGHVRYCRLCVCCRLLCLDHLHRHHPLAFHRMILKQTWMECCWDDLLQILFFVSFEYPRWLQESNGCISFRWIWNMFHFIVPENKIMICCFIKRYVSKLCFRKSETCFHQMNNTMFHETLKDGLQKACCSCNSLYI